MSVTSSGVISSLRLEMNLYSLMYRRLVMKYLILRTRISPAKVNMRSAMTPANIKMRDNGYGRTKLNMLGMKKAMKNATTRHNTPIKYVRMKCSLVGCPHHWTTSPVTRPVRGFDKTYTTIVLVATA